MPILLLNTDVSVCPQAGTVRMIARLARASEGACARAWCLNYVAPGGVTGTVAFEPFAGRNMRPGNRQEFP